MTYPGVRRASKRTELDRGTWANRINLYLEYDFITPGSVVTPLQTFTEVFEGYPDFSYGVELLEGEVLVPGDFPMVNAGVAEWDQTEPLGGQLPRIMGAYLFVVVECASEYQMKFRFQFTGVAYANPTLLMPPPPTL